MKTKIQDYLKDFPNLTATERELLYNKMIMIYNEGQIDGAMALRELYHKVRQEKAQVKLSTWEVMKRKREERERAESRVK